MKINFRKIDVEVSIDGTTEQVDVRRELGNAIFQNTPDLGELDFAREIYYNEEVEVDSERTEIIRKYMDIAQFFARVKAGVNKELDKVINPEN